MQFLEIMKMPRYLEEYLNKLKFNVKFLFTDSPFYDIIVISRKEIFIMVWEHEYEPWIDMEFTKADRGIWTQKNGEEINIKDMTDSHIQNTINMLKRRDCDSINEYWIMTLEAEQRARKEKKQKVMTNKEIINNMSTEELAKY